MQLEIGQLSLKYSGLRVVDPHRQARLAVAMAQGGQHSPVLAVSSGDDYVLIDGYARVAALSHLGRDVVEAIVLSLGEREALLWWFQQERSHPRTALEDGWLLQALIEEHGLDQRELSPLLSRSKSWVSRRLSLVRVLPASVQAVVQRGEIPSQGAAKYLVPLSLRQLCTLRETGRKPREQASHDAPSGAAV